MQRFLQDTTLNRLHTAFSRDQQEKIYIQHVLSENGARIHRSLTEGGAQLYLCGDGGEMVKGVEAALVAITAEHGGMGAEQAREWMRTLVASGRYLKDTWC